MIAQHLDAAPRPLREQRAEVPPPLEGVVLRSLAKDPDRRFPSAEAMGQALAASAREDAALTAAGAGGLGTVVTPVDGIGLEGEEPGPRVRRGRRWWLPVAVAAIVVGAAIAVPLILLTGGTSSTSHLSTRGSTASTTATTAGNSTSAATAALQPLLAQWQNSITSGPVNASEGLIAVIAHDTTSVSSTATVYAYSGGRWNVLSSKDLGFNIMTGTTIVSGSVTGGPDPDFIIPQHGGSQAVGSVLANVGGSWQIVPFRTSSGVVNEVEDLHFTDGRAVSQMNTCMPDCAAGNQTAVFFNYDSASRQFVQQP